MALTYSHDPVSTRASTEKGVWGRERAGHPGGPVVSCSNSSPQNPCPPKENLGHKRFGNKKKHTVTVSTRSRHQLHRQCRLHLSL